MRVYDAGRWCSSSCKLLDLMLLSVKGECTLTPPNRLYPHHHQKVPRWWRLMEHSVHMQQTVKITLPYHFPHFSARILWACASMQSLFFSVSSSTGLHCWGSYSKKANQASKLEKNQHYLLSFVSLWMNWNWYFKLLYFRIRLIICLKSQINKYSAYLYAYLSRKYAYIQKNDASILVAKVERQHLSISENI